MNKTVFTDYEHIDISMIYHVNFNYMLNLKVNMNPFNVLV